MSLKVWIPFTDGTAKNQGISNLTFTNSNSSKTYSSDTGKLGKCFYNNAYYNGAGLISNETITLPVTLSWFCWAKFDSFGSSASLNGVVTNHDYVNKKNMGITILYVSSTTGKLSCNTGNGSGRTYNTYTGSTVLNTGTWYHIGFTYDGSNIKFYVNGVLDGTTAYTGLSLGAAKIGIFRWDAMTENTYNMHGSLNDIRIYDHCLTPQEVKEISKGLVAHYTLGSASLTSSGNLINGLAGGGLCTVSGNSINISGTNSDTYFYIKTTKAMTSGKLYRLSCISSGFPNNAVYYFPVAAQSNTGPGLIKIKNGPCMLTFVANDTCANAGTNIIMDDTSGNTVRGAGTISGLCLEEISSVSDSSGYSRNLTITGNVSPSDSVRYDKALNTSSSGHMYCATQGIAGASGTQMTVSCWFYLTDRSGYQGLVGNRGAQGSTSSSSPLNWYLYTHTTDGSLLFHGSALNKSSVIPSLNTWHHVAAVIKSNDKYDMYLDGTKVITDQSYTWGSTTQRLTVSGYGSGGESFKGRLSDVRVYATALSADDVKDLYNLGASIS